MLDGQLELIENIYHPSFNLKKPDIKNISRGSFRIATNEEYNLSCYAWHDKNPVHVMSTADATDVEFTKKAIQISEN